MPIIRRKLDVNTVYPANMRYDEGTDTVQSNVNGDWIDNPEADPRHQTTLPPRITANPACDAAQSVVDAIKSQVDGTVDAIDNGKTAFTIAGIILSVFTFGTFAVFVTIALGIADAMLGFGTTAIEAALTSTAYETLRCILFCQMDSQGRITADDLADIQSQVTDQIGGIGATIINSMLALAGEGGINNLASTGTSTGDCDDCDCGLKLIPWPPVDPPAGVVTQLGDGIFNIALSNRGDGTYTAYISAVGGIDWTILSVEVISGTFGGNDPGLNITGYEIGSPDGALNGLHVPVALDFPEGGSVTWCGWRTGQACTVQVIVTPT